VVDILPVASTGETHPVSVALLILALIISAGWMLIGSPGKWWTVVLLITAALSVGGLAAILLPARASDAGSKELRRGGSGVCSTPYRLPGHPWNPFGGVRDVIGASNIIVEWAR
jgi:hypothetical protein